MPRDCLVGLSLPNLHVGLTGENVLGEDVLGERQLRYTGRCNFTSESRETHDVRVFVEACVVGVYVYDHYRYAYQSSSASLLV